MHRTVSFTDHTLYLIPTGVKSGGGWSWGLDPFRKQGTPWKRWSKKLQGVDFWPPAPCMCTLFLFAAFLVYSHNGIRWGTLGVELKNNFRLAIACHNPLTPPIPYNYAFPFGMICRDEAAEDLSLKCIWHMKLYVQICRTSVVYLLTVWETIDWKHFDLANN